MILEGLFIDLDRELLRLMHLTRHAKLVELGNQLRCDIRRRAHCAAAAERGHGEGGAFQADRTNVQHTALRSALSLPDPLQAATVLGVESDIS